MSLMHDLALTAGELSLAVLAMVLLVVGVYVGDRATRWISWIAVAVLAFCGWMVVAHGLKTDNAFAGMFVTDKFAVAMKCLVMLGSALAIIMSLDFIRRAGIERFEFPILILLATVGMMMMISANDLISLYLGLELQSLSLYVLAAMQRDDLRSNEAGLKYFVLGALSSGMLLYGASMVYGFAGTTNFSGLAKLFGDQEARRSVELGMIVGIVFVTAGLAFKVSAVPFHMWTPDVYEGAPTPITAFFSVAPKIAAMALFLRVMLVPFVNLSAEWFQIIWLLAVGSMIFGALAAIGQTNIKRLMAYSSIGHVGYALIGLAAGTREGVAGVIVYMAIYLMMNVGTFCCILLMRRKAGMVETIADLSGLARTHPAMAAALAVFMFSLAGVPPMAGFFGKFFIFMAAIDARAYYLAVIGVLASVVGAYYYLRIIKIMYFDAPAEPFEPAESRALPLLAAATAAFTLLFFVAPGPLVERANAAAASLLP
jgi:NADH-quinone oxidoreductase subunit N